MKIQIGPYQLVGHTPGNVLKPGQKGFKNLPVKVETDTARFNRARPPGDKGKAADVPAIDERGVVQRPIVEKSVISVRKAESRDPDKPKFAVRHVAKERFNIATFAPYVTSTNKGTLNGGNLNTAELKTNEPELCAALGLTGNAAEVNAANEATFRDELAQFALDARDLFRDPSAVKQALQPLDDELGNRLGWNAAEYAGVDTVVVGEDYVMLPNYANIEPLSQKKDQALSRLLQGQERAHGVNLEEQVPLFDGFIDPAVADKFVAEGHLFGENENRVNFMVHGTHSHRLQWECMRQWIASGRLKLPAALEKLRADNPNAYFRALLASVVYVKPIKPNNTSLWGKLVDSTDDVHRNINGEISPFRVHPAEAGMSCLAPGQMMTNLKCFGTELGLPHLQKYLNDSTVKRLRKLDVIDRSHASFDMQTKPKVRDKDVFRRQAMLLNVEKPPGLAPLPFSLPKAGQEEAMYAELKPKRHEAARAFAEGQATKFAERAPPKPVT